MMPNRLGRCNLQNESLGGIHLVSARIQLCRQDGNDGGLDRRAVEDGRDDGNMADISGQARRIIRDDGVGGGEKLAVGEELSLLGDEGLEGGEVEIDAVAAKF